MDLAEARRSFPGLADKTFLDAACVSLAPVQARDAISEFVQTTLDCPERDASRHHVVMDEKRRAAATEGARLLDAAEHEVALVESTTYGLNVAALGIPFEPGDNVVVGDLEFLQVAIPWVKLRDEGRIAEVRLAESTAGALPVEAFARVMDGRTRAVVVSSVQWTSGHRVDLAALGALCREAGAFLVVDAIQQLGAVRLSVRETPIDVLVAGGHKWLNAPFGCGLLYVSDGAVARLRQPLWGYLGLEPPEGGWETYFKTRSITPLRDYPFPAAAQSLEVGGTANYPGAIGLAASLRLTNEVGIEAASARVLELAGLLRDALDSLGVRVVSPPGETCRSGITTFEVAAEPEANEATLQALLDQRIYVAMRYTSGVGGIRVSTHWFNDEGDVERLAGAVGRLVRARARRRRAALAS
jgi:selenocysteine lyase/cysteine desulfurase